MAGAGRSGRDGNMGPGGGEADTAEPVHLQADVQRVHADAHLRLVRAAEGGTFPLRTGRGAGPDSRHPDVCSSDTASSVIPLASPGSLGGVECGPLAR